MRQSVFEIVALIKLECGWYHVACWRPGQKRPYYTSGKLNRRQAVQQICVMEGTEDFTEDTQEINLGDVA